MHRAYVGHWKHFAIFFGALVISTGIYGFITKFNGFNMLTLIPFVPTVLMWLRDLPRLFELCDYANIQNSEEPSLANFLSWQMPKEDERLLLGSRSQSNDFYSLQEVVSESAALYEDHSSQSLHLSPHQYHTTIMSLTESPQRYGTSIQSPTSTLLLQNREDNKENLYVSSSSQCCICIPESSTPIHIRRRGFWKQLVGIPLLLIYTAWFAYALRININQYNSHNIEVLRWYYLIAAILAALSVLLGCEGLFGFFFRSEWGLNKFHSGSLANFGLAMMELVFFLLVLDKITGERFPVTEIITFSAQATLLFQNWLANSFRVDLLNYSERAFVPCRNNSRLPRHSGCYPHDFGFQSLPWTCCDWICCCCCFPWSCICCPPGGRKKLKCSKCGAEQSVAKS